MLSVRKLPVVISRKLSKHVDNARTAKAIRQKFLDYFINQNNHSFVKSSPVVPFCDPTVAFVNAGMNQFKGVLLGTQPPPHKKVANSQKCIRVGGKHNDLNVVGSDGYHHTFFEMLGNWSFGDYFKKEACEMAWRLLTEEYGVHPSRLYITYFEGDPTLGLGEDVETKEIWRSMGVPEDRILPFNAKENFWEMGPTGPCGVCTEIHVDHVTTNNRAGLVNQGLHDLTELWNLVFIQYNRNSDGSITLLPEKHVDTGMGFERLTAFLQGRISNYDTDNFTYLLKAIHKNCSNLPEYRGKFGERDWDRLDTSYRILSDHARMITVSLADSMIPEQNQKLRRIIRKALLLSETVFKKPEGLLKELTNYVIEHLGPVYPEMEKNVKQIHQIIDYEEDVYRSLRKSVHDEWGRLAELNPEILSLDINENPNILSGYKEIKRNNVKSIDGKFAFKLYDTFGLDQEAIANLAEALGLNFNPLSLHRELELAKSRSKEQHAVSNNVIHEQLVKMKVPKTDTSRLYRYAKSGDKYVFEKLNVHVLKIFQNFGEVPEIGPEIFCSLLLDKSNLYTEAGGQIGDRGTIVFDDYIFEVTEVHNCNGYLLHKGYLHSGKGYHLKINDPGVLYIDPDFRLNNMRNHTAVHLLNSILKQMKGATCQKSSKVTDGYLNLDVGVFGDKFSIEEIEYIDRTVAKLIDSNIPVTINEIDSQQLLNLDGVTVVPGEVYPDSGIRLVEIKGQGFLSREPCCGTHVLNTGDIRDFCLISVKSLGRGTVSFYGVSGDRAQVARKNAAEIVDNIKTFEKSVQDNIDTPEVLNMAVNNLKQQLNFNVDDPTIIPLSIKHHCLEILDSISREIRDSEKKNLKEFIEIEMQNALESNVSKTKSDRKYMIHYLRSSLVLENVPLQKATKFCPDIPVIVISYSDNTVKARCCVPKEFKTKTFNAETWLKTTVAAVFKCHTAPPKGQDASLVCNMRPKKVKLEDWDPLLQESLQAARKFVEEHL